MNKIKSGRIFYFDALRALAIITVIMFHVYLRLRFLIAPGWGVIPTLSWFETDFLATVSRIGVSIFLMLSGALSLGREWEIKAFLKKRLPRISLPFVFWVTVLTCGVIVICYFFSPFKYNVVEAFDAKTLLAFYFNAFLGKTAWFVQNWFFWMILGTYLTMPILNKWLLDSELKEAEYFIVLWLITCLFNHTLHQIFPVDLKYFLGPIGMVVLGYYLRYTDRKIFNDIYYAFIIFIIPAIILMVCSYMFSTTSAFYVFDRYSILYAFEVMGVFCIFKNFGQLNLNFNFLYDHDSIFRKSVFSIAKYSYGIYLIHNFVMNILILLLIRNVRYSVLIVILIILTFLISWAILAALNRVPYLNQVIGAK